MKNNQCLQFLVKTVLINLSIIEHFIMKKNNEHLRILLKIFLIN